MRTYNMDSRDTQAKYYFLYQQIKEDILTGNLKKNEKLPSKRALAEHLGISLITVENAYQMLKEEGYVETRERSGYFVCEIPALKTAGGKNHLAEKNRGERKLELLHTLRETQQNDDPEKGEQKEHRPSNYFPSSVYFKTVRNVISEYGDELLTKSPNEGCAILRNSIAEYLLRYRGIFAQPKQIIIGSGAEHLYGTVVRLLGNEGIYGLEDPCYLQIEKVYKGAGVTCEKLSMGKDGIKSELLLKTQARVLHVTPFHSYPSGVTASVKKRCEYLEWAKEENALETAGMEDYKRKRYIVEDDFDSEFFMPGKPIETLYSLDTNQSVIYINTFSKSLSPSIRMGYMIIPEHLQERYRESSGAFSCTVPVLEQYVLAEFINKGYFEQHLSRVRRNMKK